MVSRGGKQGWWAYAGAAGGQGRWERLGGQGGVGDGSAIGVVAVVATGEISRRDRLAMEATMDHACVRSSTTRFC